MIMIPGILIGCDGSPAQESQGTSTHAPEDSDTPESVDCFDEEQRSSYVPAEGEIQYIALNFIDVVTSDGTDYASRSKVDINLLELNNIYASTGFQFYLQGVIHYANDDLFIQQGSDEQIYEAVSELFIPGAISIVSLPTIFDSEGNQISKNPQLVPAEGEIKTRFIIADFEAGGLAHELGHYGGLPHTFSKPVELVDGSDCELYGDRICDTPADPGVDVCTVDHDTCEITECVEVDANGDAYAPDPRNVMSYYCKEEFSPTQSEVFACTMITQYDDVIKQTKENELAAAPDLVTVNCDSESYPTLQVAIANVAGGGVVELCAGAYQAQYVEVVGGSSITVRGQAGQDVVLDGSMGAGSEPGTVFYVSDASLNIENLQIANAIDGAIYSYNSFLNLEGVAIDSCSTSNDGAAVYAYGGTVEIENSVFTNNVAEDDGGALYFFETDHVSIDNSEISQNTSSHGAGIYLRSTSLEMNNTSIHDNTASTTGGGLDIADSTVVIRGGSVSANYGTGVSFDDTDESSQGSFEQVDWDQYGENEFYDIYFGRGWGYDDLTEESVYECSVADVPEDGVCVAE